MKPSTLPIALLTSSWCSLVSADFPCGELIAVESSVVFPLHEP